MELHEKIAHLRIQHSMSQSQLARKCQVSITSIKKWESGLASPHIDNLILLCKLFNKDPNYFLGFDYTNVIVLDGLDNSECELLKLLVQDLHNKHTQIRLLKNNADIHK